jgi:hypothetical protein
MARGHLFVIVILLAAAAVAGVLAVTQTAAQATPASGSDPAIAFRLKKLDRLEASLEQQIARRNATSQSAPAVVYRRATAPVVTMPQDDEEAVESQHESESESERDD